MKILFLLLLVSTPIFSQNALPTIGSLEDIKGKVKFYAIGSTDQREVIVKKLAKWKPGVSVNAPEDAEFFIQYTELARSEKSGPYALSLTAIKGQLDVYVNRDGKKILAWSETLSSGRAKNFVPGELTRRFAKILNKAPNP